MILRQQPLCRLVELCAFVLGLTQESDEAVDLACSLGAVGQLHVDDTPLGLDVFVPNNPLVFVDLHLYLPLMVLLQVPDFIDVLF